MLKAEVAAGSTVQGYCCLRGDFDNNQRPRQPAESSQVLATRCFVQAVYRGYSTVAEDCLHWDTDLVKECCTSGMDSIELVVEGFAG